MYGLPAAGKLTVARSMLDIVKSRAADGEEGGGGRDVRLFHNHLVVDALLALFEFGSEPFRRLREQWWLEAFAAARTAALERHRATGQRSTVLFTYCPESTVAPDFFERLAAVVEAAAPAGKGDESAAPDSGRCRLRFLRVRCERDVALSRVDSASRRGTGKATDAALMRSLIEAGSIFDPEDGLLPRAEQRSKCPVVVVDTTETPAAEAAAQAVTALGLAR